MAKNLVKSNNKKIKKALDHINRFLAEREETKNELPIFLSDITDIKEILEEWNKEEGWQNQEYVQSAIDRILIIHSRKQMNVKERWLNLKNEIKKLKEELS